MMDRLKIHRIALCVALFIGVCTAAPAIIAPLSLSNGYEGIQFMPLDNEESYRARIHEVLDGHFSVAQPYLYEYKNAPVAVVPINEWLYALPAFLFGISTIVIVSKFLLPAALFFLAYLLVRRVTGDELTAIAGGLLAFFSVEFVDYGYLFSLMRGASPRPLLWTRLVNPIVGGVEVFAFLNLVWLVISRNSRYAHLVAAAVLALSVGYYFSFGFCVAMLGLLILSYVYRREMDIVQKLITTGVCALILSAPYWYVTLYAITSKEAAMRSGMFFTHAPVLNKALFLASIVATIAFVYARRVRLDTTPWIFSASLIGAGWIVFNEQVLTGREIWHHHFVQYATPTAALAALYAVYAALHEVSQRAWRIAMYVLITFCLLFGLYSITHIFPRLASFRHLQSFAPVTMWLDAHAIKDCVVLVREEGEDLERYIPAYSHCDVYMTGYAFGSVPRERLVHNFFVHMWLSGVTARSVEDYLRAHESDLRSVFYEDWNQALMNAPVPWLPQMQTDLAAGYRAFLTSDIEHEIQKYRIDYIISDGILPTTILHALPHLEEIDTVGTFYTYSFRE